MTAPAKTLDTGTRLAVDRTWLAHERTLMAWIRTATSLISFGFTIYKFFEFEAGKGGHLAHALLSPRHFAILMIATGLIALLLSVIAHRQSMKQLQEEFGTTRRSVSGIVAGVVAVMGLAAMAAALWHG
jgi:putative membrane protein